MNQVADLVKQNNSKQSLLDDLQQLLNRKEKSDSESRQQMTLELETLKKEWYFINISINVSYF